MAEPFKYKLKTDPQGMIGRECPRPGCRTYFKIESAAVDSEELGCPVCDAKNDSKKFTMLSQIEYINSIIFNKNSCPIDQNGYTNTHQPCRDYVEIPARCVYVCDACGKKFGLDLKKPEHCPYCEADRQHLRLDDRCDINCK